MSDRDNGHTLAELQAARAEIDRLRELVRWRKWPEEKPEKEGKYQVFFEWNDVDKGRKVGMDFSSFFQGNFFGYTCGFEKFYWRPIGPLPGGE